MKWFSDLKISAKLLFTICLCSLISSVSGFIGYYGVNKVFQSYKEDYSYVTLPLVSIQNISTNLERTAIEARGAIIKSDPVEIQACEDEIMAIRKVIDTCYNFNKGVIVDDTEKGLYNKCLEARSNFRKGIDKVMELAKQNKDVEADQAYDLYVQKATEEYRSALTKWLNFNLEFARTTNDKNAAITSSVSSQVIFVIIFGLMLSIILGLFISKIIKKPIARMLWVITEIQKGRIHKTRSEIASKDEIGEMSQKLDLFVDHLDVNVVNNLRLIADGEVNLTVPAFDNFDEIAPVINKTTETLRKLLAETNELVKEASLGNLKKRGNAAQFKGGYNELVKGVNNILDEVILPIQEGAEVLAVMATGDLTVKVKGDYKGDHQYLKNSINNLSESMSSALSEVSDAVQSASSASSEISSSTEQMAAGAEEQSQQTGEVAVSVDQMTRTILDTSKNATAATEASKLAGDIARQGGNDVEDTIKGMNRIAEVVQRSADTVLKLGESSNKIGEIIQVIDDIADQTNLLALNAAIEAARAGEQGRGFAVVADEVRKLAERTTTATKEIAQMIKQIQTETKGAVSAMQQGKEEVEKGKALADKSGESLKQIINGTEKVSDLVMQVAAASEEQSSASEQISKAVEGISNVTQENTAGVQQIARAAEDLARLTVNLETLVSRFKVTEKEKLNKETLYTSRGNRKHVHA